MGDRITIEKVADKIHADIPWMGGAGPKRAKKVPGARAKYAKDVHGKKVFVAWAYPLSISVCRQLRGEFGKDLKIGKDLADWARKAIEVEKAQLELRSASDAILYRVPDVAPKLAEAMANRTYQRVGASFIRSGRTVLIADEPGLGKTLEALGGLIEVGAKNILVFAKLKAIETVWGREVPRWLGNAAKVYPVKGTKAQRDKVLDRYRNDIIQDVNFDTTDKMRILVCNIEMVRTKKHLECPIDCDDDYQCPSKVKHKRHYETKFPQLFGITWDGIVVDESHKALIGKHTMSKTITQVRMGMMQLDLSGHGVKIAMSGTPYRGKLQNIWGTLNFLRPDVFSSYWRFVESYFKVDSNGYGRTIGGLDPAKADAYDQALAPYVLRRTKAEVAPDMPPRQYGGTPLDPEDPHSTIGVWLEMEPAQAKRYAEIKDDADIDFDAGTLLVNGVLPELTRRKQFAICDWDLSYRRNNKGEEIEDLRPIQPSNKFNWLLEFLEERMEAGLKVVVASQFTKVVNAFSVWLRAEGIESYTLTGETSDKAATANVAAFNDPKDPVPVFLLNTMAGGESINLDACADDVVFLDETFIPDDQEQVENRIHRMSRIHQVNVWYLRSLGTIEEQICRTTGAREMITKGRLDGTRGVEALRKLLREDGWKH